MPADLLDPRTAAPDKADYDRRAKELAGKFVKNFEQYTGASAKIRAAGPRL